MLLSSYLVDEIINFKIFLGSSSKAMADREKKRGRCKIQKFKYLKNEKSFLDEIKNIFQFLKGYHLVNNKKIDKK